MGDKRAKNENGSKTGATTPMPLMGYPGLPAMREEMERMLRRFVGDDWMSSMSRWPSMFTGWPGTAHAEMPFATLMNAPKAAMSESESDYELTVELPGLDEKDIELTLSENTLILKGEKKAEKSGKDKDYHFTERSYGTVRRSFSLPPGVNRKAMKASFSKGVLTVTLPKTHEAEGGPRRIEVSGA